MMTKCPHCGTPLTLVAANHQLGGYRQYSIFQNTSPTHLQAQPAIDTGNWERVTPVDRLQPRDITTALYDALASFSLVSIALTGPTIYFHGPWWLPPTGGLSVALWRYFGMMSLAMRLLEIVETITQTDLNKDGHTGPPQEPIALEITQKNEAGAFQRMFRFTLPEGVSESLFRQWADGVIVRPDLTQARWVSRDKFSRDAYVNLLSLLEEAGLLARDSNARNASYDLLPAGKRALRQYLIATHFGYSLTLTHSYE